MYITLRQEHGTYPNGYKIKMAFSWVVALFDCDVVIGQ